MNFAMFDRLHGDHFFDPLEIEHLQAQSASLIRELVEELAEPTRFKPRTAFAFFPPKNDLCDRRMIYLPIKDLTLRYAIALLLSEQIESEIHPQCFANRRESGAQAAVRFTEDFAVRGWTKFCDWQATCSRGHSVLLRTDISAFYDSVSYEYLVDAICRHLNLPRDCDFIALLHRLLRVPVIYYSAHTGQIIERPAVTHQGLPLGDGVQGYLANLYLKDVDDAMVRAKACYGRYVDDIRLFGNSRAEVVRQLRILQEELLSKGLNLNSAKTEIAEDEPAKATLLSRMYSIGHYGEEPDDDPHPAVAAEIDQPLGAPCRTFDERTVLEGSGDAKDFCKFLSHKTDSGQPTVPLTKREAWHVQRLRDTFVRWRGATKHAAWLLVETATYRVVPADVREQAKAILVDLLRANEVSPYGRYRILHHLLRPRRDAMNGRMRLLDQLLEEERRQIQALLPQYLSAPAFELNLIALYHLKVLNRSAAELRESAAKYCCKGCEPVRNAIERLGDLPAPIALPLAPNDEPECPDAPY